jgi:hypothetical protein
VSRRCPDCEIAATGSGAVIVEEDERRSPSCIPSRHAACGSRATLAAPAVRDLVGQPHDHGQARRAHKTDPASRWGGRRAPDQSPAQVACRAFGRRLEVDPRPRSCTWRFAGSSSCWSCSAARATARSVRSSPCAMSSACCAAGRGVRATRIAIACCSRRLAAPFRAPAGRRSR